jgi:hypothetical protein
VALHAHGHVAAVGAPDRDTSFSSSGAVFMFKVRRKLHVTVASAALVPWLKRWNLHLSLCRAVQRQGGVWVPMGMLTASDLSADDNFGHSLSMARDCVLVVGATGAAGTLLMSGAVRCEPPSRLSPLHSPTKPAHKGGSFQAYVFSPAQACGNWTQSAKLFPPAMPTPVSEWIVPPMTVSS